MHKNDQYFLNSLFEDKYKELKAYHENHFDDIVNITSIANNLIKLFADVLFEEVSLDSKNKTYELELVTEKFNIMLDYKVENRVLLRIIPNQDKIDFMYKSNGNINYISIELLSVRDCKYNEKVIDEDFIKYYCIGSYSLSDILDLINKYKEEIENYDNWIDEDTTYYLDSYCETVKITSPYFFNEKVIEIDDKKYKSFITFSRKYGQKVFDLNYLFDIIGVCRKKLKKTPEFELIYKPRKKNDEEKHYEK